MNTAEKNPSFEDIFGNRSRPTPEAMKGFTITPERWAEALEYYDEHQMELVKAAAFSRRTATSHRDFKVGAAIMTIEPNLPEDEYGIYTSHNLNPYPGFNEGREKACAERMGLEAAKSWAKGVVSITTVSKETTTGDHNKSHDALHPCSECRTMLRDMLKEGFVREDTIICNVNDAKKEVSINSTEEEIVIEKRTVKELLDLYDDDKDDKIQ